MKKIIIQGDDWGYKPEVSLGIEHAYEHGILTQTTAMANLLDITKKEEYQKRIKKLKNKTKLNKPQLGIGVHLNLTFGKPLSTIWPQKKFNRPLRGSSKPQEWQGSVWREYFSQFTPNQVEEEYRRQIELVLNIFGSISHLDSHQMTASYEPMIQIYEKLAKEYQTPARQLAPLSEKSVYGGDFVIDKSVNRKLTQKGIKMPDKNVYTLFFNKKNPIKSFLSEVSNSKDNQTTELMFHPAIGEKAEKWRLIDLDILTNQETISFFTNNNIKLLNYSQL